MDGPIEKTHTKILALQMTKYSGSENNMYIYEIFVFIIPSNKRKNVADMNAEK